jgi:ribonuclease P protein component
VAQRRPGPLSLPRSERLRGRAHIQALFEQGKREECGSVAALWRRTGGSTRVAFAVSRKVDGRAVARNRARRRLREAYRRLHGVMPDGVEMVVIARGSLMERPFPSLLGDLTRVLLAVAKGAERSPERVGA